MMHHLPTISRSRPCRTADSSLPTVWVAESCSHGYRDLSEDRWTVLVTHGDTRFCRGPMMSCRNVLGFHAVVAKINPFDATPQVTAINHYPAGNTHVIAGAITQGRPYR